MTWVEAMDTWLTFVDGKSQFYLRRSSVLAHFTRGHLVMWKLMWATLLFVMAVFLPCIGLPWEGFTTTGTEKIPPLLYLGPLTGCFSVISLWVSAVHLYQPTFTGPRFLSYHKKPYAFSWEMLDWIFFECSTTATLVTFGSFWTISLSTEEDVSGIRVVAILVHFAVVATDFYYTAPQFKSNHVVLAMLWPSVYLFMQLMWVSGGHQPTNKLLNFHTSAAPVATLGLFVGTIVSFFLLQWLSRRLQQFHERRAREAAASEARDLDSSSYIGSPDHENVRMTQFELMIESSSTRLLRQMSSASSASAMAKSHTDARDIVPAQVQLHPDTTATIHIPSSRHQAAAAPAHILS